MSVETVSKTIPLHVAFSKELGNPLYIPLQKDVDQENRIIRGYATTEALDREGQIITKEAVSTALEEYLNVNPTLRADHRPPPIGKTVLAQMDQKGLLVHGKVFKDYQAAEDAWSAIRQGAYNAFSIGGLVKEARREFDKKVDQHVTRITKLTISEISVTDAPANPECSFEILHKSVITEVLTKGEKYDRCVEHLLSDPNFTPQAGRTKEESAHAVCAAHKGMGAEVDTKMSETTVEKQEPTDQAGTSEPTLEERVAKLEAIVSEMIQERQEYGEGRTEASVAASVDPKTLLKELRTEITDQLLEPLIAKKLEALGITVVKTPLQKHVQDTPITPSIPSTKPRHYTLREQILDQMGYTEEESP